MRETFCMKKTINERDSLWAWITLASSSLIFFCSFGFLYNFGIFYNYFLIEFGDTKEKTAWVGSIPMFLMHILAWLAGWVVSKYGLRISTMVAAFPLGASLVVTSFAKDLNGMLLTFSVPFGLASCIMLMSTNIAVYRYFDKRMPVAVGMLTGGSAAAQVFLSYLVIALLDKFGWQRTLQILGVLLFLICVLSATTYLPTNYETQIDTSRKKEGVQRYFAVLKNKQFLVFLLANVVSSFSYSVSSVHQVQFAVEFGVSDNIARQFPVFSAVSNALGRFCCGFVLDIFVKNKLRYYQILMFLAGLTAMIGSAVTSQSQLIAYIWLYSFFDGQVQASIPVALRSIIGLDMLSEAFSFIMTAVAVPVMLGPPFLGFIVDKTKNYGAFFYVSGIPHLTACLILFAIRFLKNDHYSDDCNLEKRHKFDEEADETYSDNKKQYLLRLETPV